jgi:hypothetical protein
MRNLKKSARAARELAYLRIVGPILQYATSVWDPYGRDLIDEVEKVQRTAARCVFWKFQRDESDSQMLERLLWKSLRSRPSRRCVNRLRGLSVRPSLNTVPGNRWSRRWKGLSSWEKMAFTTKSDSGSKRQT